MTAGNGGIQADLVHQLARQLQKNQAATVREAAMIYRELFNDAKRTLGADLVLSKFGLSVETFISQQQQMHPEFIRQINNYLLNVDLGSTAIFAGLDDSGPHIYSVGDHGMSCEDAVAFSACGVGARHAEMQFIQADCTRNKSIFESILITYIAKKRSEKAPGVGQLTDMFWISPATGCRWLEPQQFAIIDKHYHDYETRQSAVYRSIREDLQKQIDEEIKKTREQQPPTSPDSPSEDSK